MEMFAASAGIKLLHVPFRGAAPALTALLSGTVQAVASAPGTLKQQVDDGKMRVLANWGAQRTASFPDLPTFRELGYKDVEFYIWAGLFAQSALPAPVLTRLREAMAQAVKAPEVTKTFETAGSPVAYLDAPEFSKFVADEFSAPDRGGEEDRQGGVGEPVSQFFVRREPCEAAFVLKLARIAQPCTPDPEKSGMRLHLYALTLAMSLACGIAVQNPARSQEYRGSLEQQMACTPDVWRLCFDQIPDVGRITVCLQQNTPQLSGACRAVFESNASMSAQPAPAAPPRGRGDRARPLPGQPLPGQ